MHKIYQEDIDGDGVGDLCLANLDGDDLPDSLDACPRNKIIQNTDFRYSKQTTLTTIVFVVGFVRVSGLMIRVLITTN